MKHTLFSRKGFSVLELVIVIAVIAILAAILIPTFSKVISDANDAAALEDARSIYTQYAIDHAAEGLEGVIYIEVDGNYFKVENGQINAEPLTEAPTEECLIISYENGALSSEAVTTASQG